MSKKFKINVNNTFDFEFTEADATKLDAIQISASEFHILQNNKSYNAQISGSNFNKKTYKVKVNNNTYKTIVFNDLNLLIEKMGLNISLVKNVNSIKAPMPGLILEINVSEGNEVKEDDPILILEAMKMENIITSPRDGIIKSITTKKGDAVEKNQLLIEFE
ncbi:MAG: biotin attachment protein [Flaviramulus sp.]|nr:acetyl-CoA carboxylase biotin carboxyl carrier protein subunit [Flaviramulus sp.]NNC50539.1 biotin attachment protein [Flaviramulus sp.]